MSKRTLALLLHGSGSSGQFMRSACEAADLGVDAVLVLDDRDGDVESVVDAIDSVSDAVTESGDRITLIAGVSLGAHAAALWAARNSRANESVEGLLLCLPAWTGTPHSIAAATAGAADEVELRGSSTVLNSLLADHPQDWVVLALAQSWPDYGDEWLVRALRSASFSPGPTSEELGDIALPCAVVALADDPLHPVAVAQHWVTQIPRAELVVLPRDLYGAGPRILGRSAFAALQHARRLSESQ
ncbi:MAG: hypothetical protein NTZ03_05850 [Actinobacteria bacterium]|nr:hypothetical protein [Actinomycetota bacterium]